MMEQSNVPSERPGAPRWTIGEHDSVGEEVRERYWPGTCMAIGIFTMLIVFWSAGMRTLITFMMMSKVFAVLAFAGNLIPYTWSGARMGMERLEWFLFNLLAIGPLVFSVLLLANYFVTGPEGHYLVLTGPEPIDIHRYWIEQGELPERIAIDPGHIDQRTAERLLELNGSQHGALTLARGCFGFEVIKSWSIATVNPGIIDH